MIRKKILLKVCIADSFSLLKKYPLIGPELIFINLELYIFIKKNLAR